MKKIILSLAAVAVIAIVTIPFVTGNMIEKEIDKSLKMANSNGLAINDNDASSFTQGKHYGIATIDNPKKLLEYLQNNTNNQTIQDFSNSLLSLQPTELNNMFQGTTLKYSVEYSKYLLKKRATINLVSMSDEIMKNIKDPKLTKLIADGKIELNVNGKGEFFLRDLNEELENSTIVYKGVFGDKEFFNADTIHFTHKQEGVDILFLINNIQSQGDFTNQYNSNSKMSIANIEFKVSARENIYFKMTSLATTGSVTAQDNSLEINSDLEFKNLDLAHSNGYVKLNASNYSMKLTGLDLKAYEELMRLLQNSKQPSPDFFKDFLAKSMNINFSSSLTDLKVQNKRQLIEIPIVKITSDLTTKPIQNIRDIQKIYDIINGEMKISLSESFTKKFKPFFFVFLREGQKVYEEGIQGELLNLDIKIENNQVTLNKYKQKL